MKGGQREGRGKAEGSQRGGRGKAEFNKRTISGHRSATKAKERLVSNISSLSDNTKERPRLVGWCTQAVASDAIRDATTETRYIHGSIRPNLSRNFGGGVAVAVVFACIIAKPRKYLPIRTEICTKTRVPVQFAHTLVFSRKNVSLKVCMREAQPRIASKLH